MTLHLPIGHLKPHCGLELVPRCEPSSYQPIADDVATAPLKPIFTNVGSYVFNLLQQNLGYGCFVMSS